MQVPSNAPPLMLHMPPQHSALVVHVSPVCTQNEGALSQRPLALHNPEQHSVFAVHALPDVLHEMLSAEHTLF